MSTIILPGDPASASFNDDSSPDTRLTSHQKLAVNASVIPGNSLDWYFRILQLCESVPGEVKSADVWPRFQALYGERRERIWTDLSKVRVHIVDPRPYGTSLKDTLRKVVPHEDPMAFIRQQAKLKEPTAIALLGILRTYTAERILADSFASRVNSLSKFVSNYGARYDIGGSFGVDDIASLDDFGADEKALVRKVSTWSAKSAATFHEAMDSFSEGDELTRSTPSELVRKLMEKRVSKAHTFDKGEEKHIVLLESARSTILHNLRRPGWPERPPKPYLQVDSAHSFLVRAADIAAGIASKIIEMQSLVSVVSSFEYVSYNGCRVSVADMEEEVRRMR